MNCMQDVQQEIFDMDPWEFPLNVNYNQTCRTGSEQADYCTLTEVRNTVTAQTIFLVLFFVNYCVTNMQIKLSEPNNVFQLTQDHSTMTDVLFGRNLRLKVSLTLWQRNVGELLTYFLRYGVCSWFQKCGTQYVRQNFQNYCYLTVFAQNPRRWCVC